MVSPPSATSSVISSSDLLASSLGDNLSTLHDHLPAATSDHLLVTLLLAYYAAPPAHLLLRLPSAASGTPNNTALGHQLSELVCALWGYDAEKDVNVIECSAKVSSKEFLRQLFVSNGAAPAAQIGLASRRMAKRSLSVPGSSALPPPSSLTASSYILQPTPVTFTNNYTLEPLPLPLPAPADESSAGEDLYPHRPVTLRPASPERRRSLATQRRHSNLATTGSPPAPATGGRKSSSPTITRNSTPKPTPPLPIPPSRSSGGTTPRPFLPRSPSTPLSIPDPLFTLPKAYRASPSPSPSPPKPPPPRRNSASASFTLNQQPTITPSSTATTLTLRILPKVLIVKHLERARASVQQTFLDLLREKRFTIAGEGSWVLSDTSFWVISIVVDDLENDEPDPRNDGGWGGVSRYLIDYFPVSLTLHDPIPTPSSQTFATHPLSTPLLPRALPSFFSPPISPALQSYIADLLSTLRSHALLESRMLTMRARPALEGFARLWVLLSRAVTQGSTEMVLPADVLAVLVSVVGHRIALRDVRNDKSLFWGSEFEALKTVRRLEKKRAEDVIRDVVGKV